MSDSRQLDEVEVPTQAEPLDEFDPNNEDQKAYFAAEYERMKPKYQILEDKWRDSLLDKSPAIWDKPYDRKELFYTPYYYHLKAEVDRLEKLIPDAIKRQCMPAYADLPVNPNEEELIY